MLHTFLDLLVIQASAGRIGCSRSETKRRYGSAGRRSLQLAKESPQVRALQGLVEDTLKLSPSPMTLEEIKLILTYHLAMLHLPDD